MSVDWCMSVHPVLPPAYVVCLETCRVHLSFSATAVLPAVRRSPVVLVVQAYSAMMKTYLALQVNLR